MTLKSMPEVIPSHETSTNLHTQLKDAISRSRGFINRNELNLSNKVAAKLTSNFSIKLCRDKKKEK